MEAIAEQMELSWVIINKRNVLKRVSTLIQTSIKYCVGVNMDNFIDLPLSISNVCLRPHFMDYINLL